MTTIITHYQYQNKFGTSLQDDLVKYAKDRDRKISSRFIKAGIIRTGTSHENQPCYWVSKNILGKQSMRFFLQLVSGLPSQTCLFNVIFKS